MPRTPGLTGVGAVLLAAIRETPVPVRTAVLVARARRPRNQVWARLQTLRRAGLVVAETRAREIVECTCPTCGQLLPDRTPAAETYWHPRKLAPMTIDEAKAHIRTGVPFGDVFPLIPEVDQEALRHWYVREPGLPKGRGQQSSALSSQSGDLCRDCGGLMFRSGTCLTCSACGSSSGGCG